MEEWLMIVSRQLFLYSLPVLVSLTLVVLLESRVTKATVPHPFFAIRWRGTWLPLLAAITFHRAIIIALPNFLRRGVKAAAIRFSAHLLLCLLGFLLFSWSLSNQDPVGLASLQHWWVKVLMFFNLCMASLHLLPLPGLLMGEWLVETGLVDSIKHKLYQQHLWLVLMVLAASPLLDLILGVYVIFPIYSSLNNLATNLF
ncbi:MAG: hypothetical protein L3J28_13820 [Candidatus Polarisedimenticolaceae bacterium]|nr:hypothetical protein [Candidatus Polarisedimenticolaceae bacterium]